MSSFRYRPEILEGVPERLTQNLKQFEDWFVLDAAELKKITDHFVAELEKGLTKEGGNIPMNVTWVKSSPSGRELGRFLTLDMGGTNLRVCDVTLSEQKGDFEQTQRKFKLPQEVKSGTGEELWDFVADRLKDFLEENPTGAQDNTSVPLALTFSFPVDQKNIRSGILQRWTKKFEVSGVEGEDIVPQLEAALARKNIPVDVVALINDTTGTMIASHYRDPQIKIGSIFSTGTNAAYMEECRLVPKLEGYGLPEDAKVIINTEYGAFDNDRQILPFTPFDHQIDSESLRPGTQLYEKMVSGLYIGEMLRLVMVKLHEEGRLFQDKDITRLRESNVVDATFLSIAEIDTSEGLDDMRKEFEGLFNFSPAVDEMKVCRYLTGLIATRAARLYACGIAAICKRNNIRECHVGVDGSVFNKNSGFKDRASQGLRDILDWPVGEIDLIALNASEDGSGVGAALAASLALKEADQIKTTIL
ncbi:Hexokinase [Penicillium manginii]|uniref:Hexokinase n=1 Tax=Penicillium manginii TaxID=203109 RepID=UPI0025490796|nr:Hexokinase [Penicillium manginii]KAJ5734646.1 Hexokinase [Penicillium manginii]